MFYTFQRPKSRPVLLSNHCQLCGTLLFPHEQSVCQLCWSSVPKCSTADLQKINTAHFCYPHILSFHAHAQFNGPASTIAHEFKYQGAGHLAKLAGQQMAPMVKSYLIKDLEQGYSPYMLPMPVHWRRWVKRGYNQSTQLCHGIQKALKSSGHSMELETSLLKKRRHSKSQVSFGADQRWGNVNNALECSHTPNPGVAYIIDDTCTTGATLFSAAHCLKKKQPNLAVRLFAYAYEC